MFTYRVYQWIDGERVEVFASGQRYGSVKSCEADVREQLRVCLPGTVCEIVERGPSNLQDGPVVKTVGK